VARLLVEAGANVEAKSDNGDTPLHNADGYCVFFVVSLCVTVCDLPCFFREWAHHCAEIAIFVTFVWVLCMSE